METQIIEEGEVGLEVPELENYRTSPKEYVPSKTPVFFNPVMEFSRDISVSSVQALGRDIGGLRVCDALAGVGARGLRYAKEVEGIGKTVINDRSEEAADLIQKNIDRNDLSSVEVRGEDANILLRNHRPRFHLIDLDPFGTPVPFLDSSFSAISRRGALLVTATDTAPLCGAYPRPCLRKYGAKPLRTPYSRELGLRILIGSIQRRAAAYDLALRPVLSHATQHYFRVHFQVGQGAKVSDEILEGHGYISHCFGCGNRIWSVGLLTRFPRRCECGREYEQAGPLWLRELSDEEHLKGVIEDISERGFEKGGEERDMLRLCLGEVDGPPTFYDLHELSSQVGSSPPKIRKVIAELRDRGYFASRTHFSGTGFKTDAPMNVLREVVSK